MPCTHRLCFMFFVSVLEKLASTAMCKSPRRTNGKQLWYLLGFEFQRKRISRDGYSWFPSTRVFAQISGLPCKAVVSRISALRMRAGLHPVLRSVPCLPLDRFPGQWLGWTRERFAYILSICPRYDPDYEAATDNEQAPPLCNEPSIAFPRNQASSVSVQ